LRESFTFVCCLLSEKYPLQIHVDHVRRQLEIYNREPVFETVSPDIPKEQQVERAQEIRKAYDVAETKLLEKRVAFWHALMEKKYVISLPSGTHRTYAAAALFEQRPRECKRFAYALSMLSEYACVICALSASQSVAESRSSRCALR
jgi:hypothetical protein